MGWCFYTITSSWVAFSVLTLYFKTVDWSLTTQIKQRETNVVLSWAGVCGEGRNTSFPKNACVEASTGEIDSKGIAPVLCFASSFMWEKGSNILLTLSLPEYLMEFCKVTLTFESVDKILWCDHSNESSLPVLSYGTIYLGCSSNFWVCGPNPMMWPFKWKLSACTYTWCWLFFKILQNEIRKLARNLPLASFGSERVNMSEKRCKQGKSDWVLYIPLFNSLWKFKEMLATYMYVLRMCNIHYM